MVENQHLGDPTSERMAGHTHGIGPTQVIEKATRRRAVISSTLYGDGGDEDGATPRLSKVATW